MSTSLRKELLHVWWVFFISGLPVFLMMEWAKAIPPETNYLARAVFHRIHWGDFVLFALGFPTVAVLSIWRKRAQDAKKARANP